MSNVVMSVLRQLQEERLISDEQFQSVETAVAQNGASLEQALLDAGVAPEVVREHLAAEAGVPAVAFGETSTIAVPVLRLIPEESARNYRFVPLSLSDGVLEVGTNDPDNLQAREALNFITNKENFSYKFVFLLQADLERALRAYDSLSGEVDEALTSFTDRDEVAEAKAKETAAEEINHLKEDAPVTKIVATILRYAVDGGASDIHIEPTEEKVIVRFRVDGILQKSLELPKKVQSAVIARVKILASVRLDEKRRPQDGRFSANFDGRKIDFRVSVLPTSHGEKVVMRILDNERGVSSLEDTGISPRDTEIIRRMLNEPYGIILISGPTGSGKSTTLYTMLGEVDRQTKNVMSLEDPVEYNIDGVSQSQIRPEIGYTFATGLRSALRQDPDIIMVGEIRDKETAQLAIQAALTGHLVFSTIHTNNSIGAITRLIDMGIDPFLIAPTLKLAIAQRLARRICPGTGKEVPVEGAIQMMIENEFEDLPQKYRGVIPEMKSVLHPEASPGCATGTKGRVAVMETLEVTETIQQLILKGGSEEDIYKVARSNGFLSLKEDAIIKALQHVIPFEEINNFGTKVGTDDALPVPPAANEMPQPTNEEKAADVDNPPSPTVIDV